MVCYHPLQAVFSVRDDGKKDVRFSNSAAKLFQAGLSFVDDDGRLSLPCGRCMGCRLERSRQWAVRIMHEASLYSHNCFVTLTFDDEHLAKMCPGGSLDRRHVQLFLKRLRRRFDDRKIRYYYCGEYGDRFERPHYHLCLFNLDFEDKVLHGRRNGFDYFESPSLRELWSFGFSVVTDLTFESAAYVARYCVKKVNGDMADEHYKGRLPEFGQASLKPGLGSGWLDKYGVSDVWRHDDVVVNGNLCKPPRYYDRVLERLDPVAYAALKARREVVCKEREEDNTHARLLDKEKCHKARVKQLKRPLEVSV